MQTATQRIAGLLEQSIGLNVTSIGFSTFQRALNNRKKVLGLADDEAYLAKLSVSFMELRKLVEEVVVPETWFFRDQEPFTFLTGYIAQSPKDLTVDIFRILSLPCSTGEEPFSIAMTLLQAGLKPSSFYIDAVDVSNRALAVARKAVYKKNSFRSSDIDFRDNFFHKTDEGFVLSRMVRDKVRFVQGNILQPGFLDSLGRYDVVFCRNVLIYFNKEAQEQAIRGLYNLLVPNGLLFTGHAEASLFMGTRFVSVTHSRAFAFYRQDHAPLQSPEHKQGMVTTVNDHRIQGPPAPLFKRSRPGVQRASTDRFPQRKEDEYRHVQQLADAGLLEEAVTLCEDYLNRHGPSAKWYYILGIVRDSQGQTEEALRCFRKAVYLDPANVDSLIQLSLLAERAGNMDTAENYKRRVRIIQAKG